MSTPQKHLFKSRIPSCQYAFKKGRLAIFRRGEYITDVQEEIDELTSEIASGHPTLYVDPKEVTVSPERDDPIASLRAKIALEERARILEEMAAATNPGRDLGTSEQGKLNAASTSDIAPTAANGDASARLAALRSQVAVVTAK